MITYRADETHPENKETDFYTFGLWTGEDDAKKIEISFNNEDRTYVYIDADEFFRIVELLKHDLNESNNL